eukprot:GHRR01008329.1.p1 GENE.GHRR01008329.1~~GHRR01008329.1.p1  ORF type:complete len:1448 (+),score=551.05 GHRR01008329.1:1287-5630(+)
MRAIGITSCCTARVTGSAEICVHGMLSKTRVLATALQIILLSVGLDYEDPSDVDNCEQYNAKVVFGLKQQYGLRAVQQVNETAGRVAGPINIPVLVLNGSQNGSSKQVGTARAIFQDVTFNCILRPSPASTGLTAGALAAAIAVPVGVVLLLAGVLLAWWCVRRCRQHGQLPLRAADAADKNIELGTAGLLQQQHPKENGSGGVSYQYVNASTFNQRQYLNGDVRDQDMLLVDGHLAVTPAQPGRVDYPAAGPNNSFGSAGASSTSTLGPRDNRCYSIAEDRVAQTSLHPEATIALGEISAVVPASGSYMQELAAPAPVQTAVPIAAAAAAEEGGPLSPMVDTCSSSEPQWTSTSRSSGAATLGSAVAGQPIPSDTGVGTLHPNAVVSAPQPSTSRTMRRSAASYSTDQALGIVAVGRCTSDDYPPGSGSARDGSVHSSGGSHRDGDREGDHNSSLRLGRPKLGVHALLKQRSDMAVLRDLKIGPLLGRGSYGRVYKGRWKAVTVAVKIIEHQEGAPGTASSSRQPVNIGHESVLATSIAHPNVVHTYHISTMTITQRNALARTWLAEADCGSAGGRASSIGGGRDAANDLEVAGSDSSETSSNSSFDVQKDILETWMLMEFCEKGSLERAIGLGRFIRRQDQKPEMIGIYKALLDTASGLDYLHSIGVVHGDLKTANVLLKGSTRDVRGFACKISDFGLSRVLDLDATHVSTRTYGTIVYMPSELLLTGRMTQATDIYSFGLMMWELISSQRAVDEGLSIGQIFYMIAYQNWRPVIPPNCPLGYAELMAACWHEEPEQRPTVQELLRTLQRLYVAEKQRLTATKAAADAAAAAATAAAVGAAVTTGVIPGAACISGSQQQQVNLTESSSGPDRTSFESDRYNNAEVAGTAPSAGGDQQIWIYPGQQTSAANAATDAPVGVPAIPSSRAPPAAVPAASVDGATPSTTGSGGTCTGPIRSSFGDSSLVSSGGQASAGTPPKVVGSAGLPSSGGSGTNDEYQPWATAVSQAAVRPSADGQFTRRPSLGWQLQAQLLQQQQQQHLHEQQVMQMVMPQYEPTAPAQPHGILQYSMMNTTDLYDIEPLPSEALIQNISSSNNAVFGNVEDLPGEAEFLDTMRRVSERGSYQRHQQHRPVTAAQDFVAALEMTASGQGTGGGTAAAAVGNAQVYRQGSPGLSANVLVQGTAAPSTTATDGGQASSTAQPHQQLQQQQQRFQQQVQLPVSQASGPSTLRDWGSLASTAMPSVIGSDSSSLALEPSSSMSTSVAHGSRSAAGSSGEGPPLVGSNNSLIGVASGAQPAAVTFAAHAAPAAAGGRIPLSATSTAIAMRTAGSSGPSRFSAQHDRPSYMLRTGSGRMFHAGAAVLSTVRENSTSSGSNRSNSGQSRAGSGLSGHGPRSISDTIDEQQQQPQQQHEQEEQQQAATAAALRPSPFAALALKRAGSLFGPT